MTFICPSVKSQDCTFRFVRHLEIGTHMMVEVPWPWNSAKQYRSTHRCSDVQAFAFPAVDHSGWSWWRHRRQCPASVRRWSTRIPAFRRRRWRHRHHLPGVHFHELIQTESRTRDRLRIRQRLRCSGHRSCRTSMAALSLQQYPPSTLIHQY